MKNWQEKTKEAMRQLSDEGVCVIPTENGDLVIEPMELLDGNKTASWAINEAVKSMVMGLYCEIDETLEKLKPEIEAELIERFKNWDEVAYG